MHKLHTGWGFLLCVILFAGACSDDEPVSEPEAEVEAAAQQPKLPVREWYPTPKHARPRISISPAQPHAQMPMNQQPTVTLSPVPQQQWNMLPQPYVTPQPVQPQTQWNGTVQPWQAPVQQPVMPQQYQFVYPYQYQQRPWGSVPYDQGRQQPEASQNSSQQGTATDYWGWGGRYNVYPAPGMPGYVW